MRHEEEDKDDKPAAWIIIRDLFILDIEPAKSWAEADCLGDLSEMCAVFSNAHPSVFFLPNHMELALYDMNIKFERNEHNNKFYYLAKWR